MLQNKSTSIKILFYCITIIVPSIGIYTSIQFFTTNTVSFNPFVIQSKLSSWYFLFLIPVITLFNLSLRFLRWTFLLRTFGCIFEIKELFLAYLTGFIGNVFPFYFPYLLRLTPLRGRFYTGIIVLGIDILIDFAALFTLYKLSGYHGLFVILGLFLVALIVISRFPSKGNGRPLPFTGICVSVVFAFLFTVPAWYVTAGVLKIILHDFGIDISYFAASNAFALSQIKGSLALIPGGIMTTGKTLIVLLNADGVPFDLANYSTVIVRFFTFWFTIFISISASLFYYRYNVRRETNQSADHFDTIAEDYTEEIPEHIRTSLLDKKIGITLSYLPRQSGLRGLDIGCGQGWYMQNMQEHGYQMIGIDYSFGQLRNASVYGNKSNYGRVSQGSITHIPLKTDSVDFAYSINTFHHLVSVQDQRHALDELYRVLKPGGVCLIHEMNVKNPIFRFYMSYLFPLIKSIDVGTEIWVKGNEKMLFEKFCYKSTVYQTFLPDFLPRQLYQVFKPVEHFFEQIPFIRSFSAHLCILLVKR